MKKVIDAIKTFFENNDWKYNYNENDNVLSTGADLGNVFGNVKMFIVIEEESYNVYTILNSKVEKKYYPLVAEFLHRANYGLKNGNFEMDYDDGEVRFKCYVNFINTEISQQIIEDSVYVGFSMINTYGKGLLKLMLGLGTAEECIKYSEKNTQESSN